MSYDIEFVQKLGYVLRRELVAECTGVVAARGFVRSNLMGLCSYASYAMVDLMYQYGMKARHVEGWYNGTDYPHCWVEWGRWIIDLTATQFGVQEEVYIVEAHSAAMYSTEYRHTWSDPESYTLMDRLVRRAKKEFDRENKVQRDLPLGEFLVRSKHVEEMP